MAFPKHRLATSMVVINKENKILLIKNWKRGWEFPGGYVENGESVRTAAIREVKEEAGIEVKLIKLCGISQSVKTSRCTLVFLGTPINDEQPVGRDDAVDAAYFSIDEAFQKIKLDIYKETIAKCFNAEEHPFLIES